MKTIIYCISLAMLCLSLTACNDPFKNEQLPPATQTGANTFGFKLDGEVWLPYYRGLKFDNRKEVGASLNDLTKGLTIGANRENDIIDQSFHISLGKAIINMDLFGLPLIYSSSSNHSFLLDEQDTISLNFRFTNYNENSFNYHIHQSSLNKLIITKLDSVNNIISGEFEFTVINHDGRELKITEGRFDFNYPYER